MEQDPDFSHAHTGRNISYDCFAEEPPYCGSTAWIVINLCTTTITVFGNVLTISAILLTKKLSSIVANQFVFSLAVSDLLVGMSIPYHMSFYLVSHFGKGRLSCLLRFVLISFACSSSIMNLLYIAADRYVAIVYPLHYNKFLTRKTSVILIVIGWLISFSISIVPLVWNDWHEGIQCELVEVVPSNYLNFVLCPMFTLIWLMMLLLYSRICREANGQARRMRNASSLQSILAFRDSKSFQVMMTILGCFTVCWLPYFVITLYARRKKETSSALLYEIAFNIAVANSGMNPLIYAWKNTSFRKAFLCIARCRSPNSTSNEQFVTNHAPNRKNSISLNGISNYSCQIEESENHNEPRVINNCQKVRSNPIPSIITENALVSSSVRVPDKTKGVSKVRDSNGDAQIRVKLNGHSVLDRDRHIKTEIYLEVKCCALDRDWSVKEQSCKTADVKTVNQRPRSW